MTTEKNMVLSVQLGKTLGLTKVPITWTEESTQVRKKFGLKLFWHQGGEGVDNQGELELWVLVH